MKKIPIKKIEIERAYLAIKKKGLAIIPTRVGHVLLGNSEESIFKMFSIKHRPLTKPCVIISRYDILQQVAVIPQKYKHLIDTIEHSKILCGFILKRKDHKVFRSLSKYVNQNAQKTDGSSCFVINHGEYTQYLVDRAWEDKTLIVGSSANKSGTGNEGIFENIPAEIRDNVAYGLAHNEFVAQEYDPVSRQQGVMVDLMGEEPVIIRRGLKCVELEAIILAFTGKKSIPFRDNNTGRTIYLPL